MVKMDLFLLKDMGSEIWMLIIVLLPCPSKELHPVNWLWVINVELKNLETETCEKNLVQIYC